MKIALALITAAIAAPIALGVGPAPGVVQGRGGVVSPDGTTRYVAVPNGSGTVIRKSRVQGGRVLGSLAVSGSWGVPLLTVATQTTGGVSRDGKTLVLAQPGVNNSNGLPTAGRFLVLKAQPLTVARRISLGGAWSFDALSPNGKYLYLIQHHDSGDATHYLVRVYDLAAGKLLPDVIADKRQANEAMRGYPLARVESPGGAWAFTLYVNPGKHPFVHALDTVNRRAFCLDFTYAGSEEQLWQAKLSLDAGKIVVSVGSQRIAELSLPT